VTVTAAGTIDREYLDIFFRLCAIDEFVVVLPSAIDASPGRRPIDLFPVCRMLILFGRWMGDELFLSSVHDTEPNIRLFKQGLARAWARRRITN
jgi:hypothetical protein